MSIKLFAQFGGRQCGPYTLEELADAGVRPDTYVWCKGMTSWRKASEVADVCRFWREKLQPTSNSKPLNALTTTESAVEKLSANTPQSIFEAEDTTVPPRSLLPASIIVFLFCFFPTGIAAIWYAWQTSKVWKDSEHASGAQKDKLQREAYDMNRSAKMWIGITFFMGMIAMAFAMFQLGK